MAVQTEATDAHIPLSVDEREAAGAQLQHMLVDLIDLALIGKQAHWNVEGRSFHSLHAQLDELVAAWQGLGDEVAERAVALGVPPDGQARTVAEASEIRPLPTGTLRDRDVVEGLAERLAQVVARTRERIQATAEGDPVSEDLLIQVAAKLEQHLWMIRAQRDPS